MRTLHSHAINPANEKLTIHVVDDPGVGGANHRYQIEGFDTENNPSRQVGYVWPHSAVHLTIFFQNGPIPEVGNNGITNEALLAILIDRMRGFQSGKFACDENAQALAHLEIAMDCLHFRAAQRMKAGVEGTLHPDAPVPLYRVTPDDLGTPLEKLRTNLDTETKRMAAALGMTVAQVMPATPTLEQLRVGGDAAAALYTA